MTISWSTSNQIEMKLLLPSDSVYHQFLNGMTSNINLT